MARHTRRIDDVVPALLAPDSLKSSVTTACFYDPEINPTYHDLESLRHGGVNGDRNPPIYGGAFFPGPKNALSR